VRGKNRPPRFVLNSNSNAITFCLPPGREKGEEKKKGKRRREEGNPCLVAAITNYKRGRKRRGKGGRKGKC